MKKTYSILLLVISLGLITITPSFGQTALSTKPGPSPTIASLSPSKILLVQDLGHQLANRIEVTVKRFRKLITRSQSRVAKLQTNGQDAKQLKSWLTSMTTNLDNAQSALTKFRGDLSTLSPSDDQKRELKTLQLDIKMAKDALTATQTTLKRTAQALASASAAATSSASSRDL